MLDTCVHKLSKKKVCLQKCALVTWISSDLEWPWQMPFLKDTTSANDDDPSDIVDLLIAWPLWLHKRHLMILGILPDSPRNTSLMSMMSPK